MVRGSIPRRPTHRAAPSRRAGALDGRDLAEERVDLVLRRLFRRDQERAEIGIVHISNEGNNNSNNTIVGDNNVIINANFGITINV
jgi:hypothetical protein